MSRRDTISRSEGFSLSELVLVILVLGITAAIALPRYSVALGNYRVGAAARRLAADLAYAQSLAKASSSSKTVSFNLTAGTYQIAGVADPDHPGSTYTVTLTSDPFQATIASVSLSSAGSGGTVSVNTPALSFNGYGIPSAGATIIILSGAAQETLTLDADTGTVSISP